MKKAIVIMWAVFLLSNGTAMADRAGWDRIDRGMMGYGMGYDCSNISSAMANANLKLTAEQAAQLRTLDEKYGREIEPIRKQLYGKGRALKEEWLQPEPDRGRIETLRGEVAKLQERMRAIVASHRADVLKVLTPEQQTYVPDGGPGHLFTKPAGAAGYKKWR